MSAASFDHSFVSCVGKLPYLTYKAAELVTKRKKNKGGNRKLHVYRCNYCNKYHIGSSQKLDAR